MPVETRPVVLAHLRQIRPVKAFSGGRQSKSVQLLENGLIAKQYDASKKHAEKMKAELKNLKRVETCDFVPKLIALDEKERILYLSNCGRRPKRYTKSLVKEVKKKVYILKHKYNMTRSFANGGGLPRLANVAVDTKGRVNLVDVGPPWHQRKHTTTTKH